MRVLITGGAGSVGRELAGYFVKEGDSVRAFDLPVCDFSPLEAMGAEVVKGDIGNLETVRAAVSGMDVVVHLAALLPPVSERNPALTFAVNVDGTRRVVEAMQAEGGKGHLVFSSSVVTYGNTQQDQPPVTVNRVQRPGDVYAESKVKSEQVVLSSGIDSTVLRISGVSIAAFLNPPDPWPFQANQRMEFVNRTDVVASLLAAAKRPGTRNKVFNVAGGPTWQMLGGEYVKRFLEAMDMPADDANYLDDPGWFDWYDTTEAQAVLGYQKTTFPDFLDLLRKAVEEALA